MDDDLPVRAVAPPTRASGSTRRTRSRAGSPLLSVLLVVLIVGLLAAGWLVFEQRERMTAARRTLAEAEGRIGRLEDRLRMTDAQLSESGTQTNEQLTFWESEIRKLWDIGNKRNKRWIEENRESARQLGETVASAGASVAKLKSSVAALEASADRQQQVIDRVNELDMQLQGYVAQQRDLVDKTNAAVQTVSRLEADLKARVGDNEEAIRAFDAQRSQLNADMRALRDEIRAPVLAPGG